MSDKGRLYLTRDVGESIVIGNVVVTVLEVKRFPGFPPKVRLGFTAPRDVSIVRTEVLERNQQ